MLEVVDAYNKNPQKYTDQEAEFIATIAKALGTDFKREKQPVKKGLYNLLETVTLGYLPDQFKPVSRGETVYGETLTDQIGGGLGTGMGYLGGAGALGYGLYRGGRGIINRFMRGKKGGAGGNSMSSGGNSMSNYGGAGGESDNLLQLTAGRSQVKRNRFPIEFTTGQPITLPRSSRIRTLDPRSRKAIRRDKIYDENFRRGEEAYFTPPDYNPYDNFRLSIGEKINLASRDFKAADRARMRFKENRRLQRKIDDDLRRENEIWRRAQEELDEAISQGYGQF
jgi:hypothetical protein